MKTKIFAVACAAALALSIITPTVFAEETEPESSVKTTTESVEVIPVHGYIGSDTSIETPPDSEIYVEIPVKILFAAFEKDGGNVTSPKYTIKNLSEISDIKVEVENFEQVSDPAVDLDGKLSLKLVSLVNEDIVPGLFPADYPPAKLLTEKLPKYVEASADNKIDFLIGGEWQGEFDSKLYPVFDMTLKFSVAE